MRFADLKPGDVCELHSDWHQYWDSDNPLKVIQVVTVYEHGSRGLFLLPCGFNCKATGWSTVRKELWPDKSVMNQFDKWDIGVVNLFVTRVIENRPIGDFDVNVTI